MHLIAAADDNWAIGKDNELLIHISEDMRYFRSLTTGNVVVMGRKTLESFPGGKPLSDRVNIVMTRQKNYDAKGAAVVCSADELREELKKYDTDQIYIIGGAQMYAMMTPYCEDAYITRLYYSYEADAFMPDLDKTAGWEIATRGEEKTCFDLIYRFLVYKNTNPMDFFERKEG